MTWRDTLIRLPRLEAEAISIMREVASDFRNPVMLYSIGKDSGAMLLIAQEVFSPSKPPFPLLHVGTTWHEASVVGSQRSSRSGRLHPK